MTGGASLLRHFSSLSGPLCLSTLLHRPFPPIMTSVSAPSDRPDRPSGSSRPISGSHFLTSLVSLGAPSCPLSEDQKPYSDPTLSPLELLSEIPPFSLPELDPAELAQLTEQKDSCRSRTTSFGSTPAYCSKQKTYSGKHAISSRLSISSTHSRTSSVSPSFLPSASSLNFLPLLFVLFRPFWRLQAVLMSGESARFVEKFKYLIVASQLLAEGTSSSTPQSPQSLLSHPPFASSSSADYDSIIPLGWVIVLFATAKWAARTQKLLSAILFLSAGTISYALLQKRKLRNVRNSVLKNAEKLVSGLAKWDSVAGETLGLIGDADAARAASHADGNDQSLPEWRISLEAELRRILCVVLEGCQNLNATVDPMELDKLLDVYSVMDGDVREAVLSLEQEKLKLMDQHSISFEKFGDRGNGLDSPAPSSILYISSQELRSGWRRVVTSRRLLLCTLIVIPAVGIVSEEIARWDTVDRVLQHVQETVWESLSKLNSLLQNGSIPVFCPKNQESNPVLPQNQPFGHETQCSQLEQTPHHSNSHSVASSADHVQASLNGASAQAVLTPLMEIFHRLRATTALVSLLREDTQRLLNPSMTPSFSGAVDPALVARFDLIGAELKDLVSIHAAAIAQLRGRVEKDNRRRMSVSQQTWHHRGSSLSPVSRAQVMATMSSLADQACQRNYKRRSFGPFGLEVKTHGHASAGDFTVPPGSPRGVTIPISTGTASGLSPFQKKQFSPLGNLFVSQDSPHGASALGLDQLTLESKAIDPSSEFVESVNTTGDTSNLREREKNGSSSTFGTEEARYLVSHAGPDGEPQQEDLDARERRILPSNPGGKMIADLEALLGEYHYGRNQEPCSELAQTNRLKSRQGDEQTDGRMDQTDRSPRISMHRDSVLSPLTNSRPSRPGKPKKSRQRLSGDSLTSATTIEEDRSASQSPNSNYFLPAATSASSLFREAATMYEDGIVKTKPMLMTTSMPSEDGLKSVTPDATMAELLAELAKKVPRDLRGVEDNATGDTKIVGLDGSRNENQLF